MENEITLQQFLHRINQYFSCLNKIEKIEDRMNQFHLTYDPEYDEETIALETYRREIEYYLPIFLEK
jgi:hypothetical protein